MKGSLNLLSDADICRKQGWTVGTRLIGTDAYGTEVITITAIGEENILARCDAHGGELNWTLHAREWKEQAPRGEEEQR